MNRKLLAAIFTVLLASTSARAADITHELRYQFATGDILRYSVKHRMSVRNTIDEETQEAKSETDSVKVWKIVDVLPDGNLELINLVERLHMKNQLPDRVEMEYDSEKDEEPPAGFEDAAKAVGVPISLVRMTPSGEVIDREMKVHQPAADPTAPIAVRLPDDPVAIGDTWDEPIDVTVQLRGGGTKAIETRRHYKLASVEHGIAVIDVSFQVLSPVNPHIEAQLVQRLMKGTVRFDLDAGRVVSQQMDVDKRVLGYAGATSSMHYVMRMEEKLLDDVAEVARKPE
jgi:hypothetical protein